MDVENEDEKENLSQKAIVTKNKIDEKKQEMEIESKGDINKRKEKFDIFDDNDNRTTDNNEIKANLINHGDNRRNNGEKDDVEN